MLTHLTLAVDGRAAVFADERIARHSVAAVMRAVGPSLLIYGFADDHVHLVVSREDAVASAMRGALRQSLRSASGVGFGPAHEEPVESRAHLQRLVPYLHRQGVAHGLTDQPALWGRSSLLDLIAVQRTPGFRVDNLGAQLPRLTVGALLEPVGLDVSCLQEASDEALHRVGPSRVVQIARRALSANPEAPKTAVSVLTNRVATHLLSGIGFEPKLLGQLLQVDPRSVRRWRAQDVDPSDVALVRRRVSFETAAMGVRVRPTDREVTKLRRGGWR